MSVSAPAHPIRSDELSTCISCGLCLNDCPTFRVLGDEADSPRGRIALMRTLVATTGTPDASLVAHLDACLVCRACETACPSGVPFGRLMEGAREIVRERVAPPLLSRMALRLGLGTIAHPGRLAIATRVVWLYQRSGLRAIARRLGLVPRALRDAERLLPDRVDAPYAPRDEPAVGEERHHVAFFAGCVMRAAFGDTDRATVRVLRKNGCRVSVPRAQVCCGALHAHAGAAEESRRLARRNIEAFESSGAETVLVNAAGCGAQLKGYGELLRDDPAWRERGAAFAGRVRDVTEFLAANWIATPERMTLRVAYQDACHLAHGQRIRHQPRALLSTIPGVTIVELGDGERCCGSAGIYNLTHPEVAEELGRMKANAIENVKPDVVVTANPGCLMQIAAHLRLAGARTPVRHIIDLLDEAI
jgi:glycolate oxidase iron-sulfur subunit